MWQLQVENKHFPVYNTLNLIIALLQLYFNPIQPQSWYRYTRSVGVSDFNFASYKNVHVSCFVTELLSYKLNKSYNRINIGFLPATATYVPIYSRGSPYTIAKLANGY